jgi:hypothetical protein
MNPSRNNSKVLKWSLVVAIVIVLNLFYNYTLSLVFSVPEYNNFCSAGQVNVTPQTQQECVLNGGSWTTYANSKIQPARPLPSDVTTPSQEPTGYCDPNYTCQKNYTDAQKVYDKNVFISLVVLGVITFALALVFKGSEVLSVALSLGAVLDFVIASIRYWGSADNLIKVFILALALAVLIYLAVKKFGDKIQS